jgi:glucosyl-dolichyl phosphate glucuronosyltransferase
MDISIIICTYNRCRSLDTVLQSVQNLSAAPGLAWETLVIDNNSGDATRDVVEKHAAAGPGTVRYLFEGRQGKSHALNTGIKTARGEILAFTDDDVVIDPAWLLNFRNTFERYECCGAGGRIVPVLPGKKPNWLRTDTPTPYLNALGCFDYGEGCCDLKHPPFGANMAFRKSVFTRHGPFRTDLGPTEGNAMGKGEDSELSLRLLGRGEKIMYVPGAIVYHRVQEEKLNKKSFLSYYYNYGRFRARTDREAIPENAVRYFGVPRYLIREFLGKYLDCFLARDTGHRMTLKLDCYELLGRMTEYVHSRKAPQA